MSPAAPAPKRSSGAISSQSKALHSVCLPVSFPLTDATNAPRETTCRLARRGFYPGAARNETPPPCLVSHAAHRYSVATASAPPITRARQRDRRAGSILLTSRRATGSPSQTTPAQTLVPCPCCPTPAPSRNIAYANATPGRDMQCRSTPAMQCVPSPRHLPCRTDRLLIGSDFDLVGSLHPVRRRRIALPGEARGCYIDAQRIGSMFCLKMHRRCHRCESDNQTTGAQQSRTKKTHEPSLAKANYANGTEPSSHCCVEQRAGRRVPGAAS